MSSHGLKLGNMTQKEDRYPWRRLLCGRRKLQMGRLCPNVWMLTEIVGASLPSSLLGVALRRIRAQPQGSVRVQRNRGRGADHYCGVVDDLIITSVNPANVQRVENEQSKSYGQFRTTKGKELTYLGCTWDFTAPGLLRIRQTGMIQDLVL